MIMNKETKLWFYGVYILVWGEVGCKRQTRKEFK